MLVKSMENRLGDLMDAPPTFERLTARMDRMTGRNKPPGITEDEARARVAKLVGSSGGAQAQIPRIPAESVSAPKVCSRYATGSVLHNGT